MIEAAFVIIVWALLRIPFLACLDLDLGLDLMRVCCCLLPLGAGGGINVDLLLSALVSEAGIDLFFPSAGVTYVAVLGGEMSELPRDRVGHASPFCCASLPTR